MVEPRVAPMVPGPRADEDTITFALEDQDRRLCGVRLDADRGIWADELDFGYDEQTGRWTLTLPRPPVQRVEYRLRLRHCDGGTETVNDPGATRRAPGAFGEKSVLELPGYAPPRWATTEQRWERSMHLRVPSRGGPIEVTVLSPEQPTTRLLIAHDGPEYDRLARLGVFAAAVVHQERVQPFHLALADPGPRDQRYSANPGYGAALATRVIPALHRGLRTQPPSLAGHPHPVGSGVRDKPRTPEPPFVLMGASLGGLAALHVQRRHPRGIGGLFLQSGSFFVPEHDECESGFPYYRRVIRYVASVPRSAAPPVPTVMTCGAIEENVHNNRLMAATLRRQGYPAKLHEVPDVHNFTAWRDAFDPYLVELLKTVWGHGDA